MRVLQITAAYKPAYIYGGPTMSVAALSEHLAAAGVSVDVFTTTANGPGELDVPTGQPLMVDGIKVTYFKRITKDHTHLSPALLKAVWTQVKSYDVVHIHAWWNLVSILSCLIATWQRVPVVISPRGMLSSYSFKHRNNAIKALAHQLLCPLLLKKSHFHTTSAQEEAEVRCLIQPASIFNLPNFVKLPPPAPVHKQPAGHTLNLLFYSRIDAKKGLELLLNALPLLTIPYQLTVAGDGEEPYLNKLKNLIQANHTDKNVSWAGFQHQNKFKLLQEHDLMVLPSYNENFGNVVIESLSSGTAVLISKYVGLAGYVAEHSFGWICDTTPADIARQITLIYQQRYRLTEISRQAPATVHADFTGSKLTSDYINSYQRITGNYEY